MEFQPFFELKTSPAGAILRIKPDCMSLGRVSEGFAVEATGDVTMEGEVDGAVLISRNGSVTVKGGTFGRNKASIVAKKEVRLSFTQQCCRRKWPMTSRRSWRPPHPRQRAIRKDHAR